MKVKDVLVSFSKLNQDLKQEEETKNSKEVIVASHKDAVDARYYLHHNPTSFY